MHSLRASSRLAVQANGLGDRGHHQPIRRTYGADHPAPLTVCCVRVETHKPRKREMSNDLTIVSEHADDGWGDAAAEANERVLRGRLFKFADWNWFQGKESIKLP